MKKCKLLVLFFLLVIAGSSQVVTRGGISYLKPYNAHFGVGTNVPEYPIDIRGTLGAYNFASLQVSEVSASYMVSSTDYALLVSSGTATSTLTINLTNMPIGGTLLVKRYSGTRALTIYAGTASCTIDGGSHTTTLTTVATMFWRKSATIFYSLFP